MILVPPAPKWDAKVDGVQDGFAWALEYERSLLPPDITFPRLGQIWEAVRDCQVNFIAMVPRCILPGGRASLVAGERVRILTEEPKPIEVTFQPVRYEELHSIIVPEEIRERRGYSYYWLSLRIARTRCCLRGEPGYFHELFRLVEDMA